MTNQPSKLTADEIIEKCAGKVCEFCGTQKKFWRAPDQSGNHIHIAEHQGPQRCVALALRALKGTLALAPSKLTGASAEEVEQKAKDIVGELMQECDGCDFSDADSIEHAEEIIETALRTYAESIRAAAVEEALRAAKRGFNSKSKGSKKAGVYSRIRALSKLSGGEK